MIVQQTCPSLARPCSFHLLDVRAATTKALSRTLINDGLASQAVVSDNAKHKGGKPRDNTEERECLSSPPLITVVAARKADTAPSPCAAAVCTVEPNG